MEYRLKDLQTHCALGGSRLHDKRKSFPAVPSFLGFREYSEPTKLGLKAQGRRCAPDSNRSIASNMS